jgi:hypothetical protein
MLRRRTLLKNLMSTLAALPLPAAARANLVDADHARVLALAAVALPSHLGEAGTRRAVQAFSQWLRDYRPGAELDHGYGITKLQFAPASPAYRYPTQLADLDRRCAGSIATASLADRRRAITEALDAAGVRALPPLPDGGHIVSDLMAHYFNGAKASDQLHGRYIGRFDCRGLSGSEERPPLLIDDKGTL